MNKELREESEDTIRNEIEKSDEFSDICKKIREYIPNVNIEFMFNDNTQLLEIVFIEEKSVMSILKDNTWAEIKRHINAIISKNKDTDCSICCEKIISRTGCTKCSSDWCVECYINLFKTGQGIIKCPYCRFEYGFRMNEQELNMGVANIRAKLSGPSEECQQSKDDVIKKMEEYGKKSEDLYKICVEECCDDLPDPITWIHNQDKMRSSWEDYNKDMSSMPDLMRNMMLNNSFSTYMSFMYDTYPDGFGRELKYCYDNNIVCDGAEIFIKLTSK